MTNDYLCCFHRLERGRPGRDRMVVGCRTICAISPYHQYSWEFEPRSWGIELVTALFETVCQ